MKTNVTKYGISALGILSIIMIVFLITDKSTEKISFSDLNAEAPKDGIIILKDESIKSDNTYEKIKIENQIKSLQDSIKTSEKMIGMKTVDQERLHARINEQKNRLSTALNELSRLNK